MRFGVVGAGLMGAEIALSFALAGHDVLLTDRDHARLGDAMDRLRKLLEKGIGRGLYAADTIEPTLARIVCSTSLESFADREMITEAVFEAVDVKFSVMQLIDRVAPTDCIVTTNTSTIPISTLAAAFPQERRGNFLGTHYFSPVSRMKLVEVIPGFETSDGATERVLEIMAQIGKVGIRVKDVPGFAVNRMLHVFIIEAVRLIEEGVASPDDIDTACRLGLGHPIGPFALMDNVTSSLCVQAQEIMQEAYGERFRPPALLKQRVRAGFVGGKGRKGWLRGEGN